MTKLYFDIGGTNIEYIISKNNKETFNKFPVLGISKDALLDKMASIIDQENDDIEIGISSPTGVNTKTGYCEGISGIKDYGNFNLYKEIESKVKISKIKRMKALNDGNAALLGIIEEEYKEKKPQSAVMIVLGTGIGGAIYINGQIFSGINNIAGEFGYPLWKGDMNISQSLSSVNVFKRNFNGQDGKEIFSEYHNNKDTKIKIDKWLSGLSKLVTYISFFINPEVIVFNGGVFKNKLFQDLVKEKYYEYFNQNNIDNISKTKLKFFSSNKNYSLLGAKAIINNE